MWKRQNEIKGVSAGPVIELKALLFEKTEEVKNAKIAGERRAKKVRGEKKGTLHIKQNKGVAERDAKDLAAIESETMTPEKAEAALKAKADLYGRMVRGEVLESTDTSNTSPDKPECMVDFGVKRYEDLTSETSTSTQSTASTSFYAEPSPVVRDAKKHFHSADYLESWDEDAKRRRHLELLGQVLEETRGGREQAQETKMQRHSTTAARLETIRRKQLSHKQYLEHQQRLQAYNESRELHTTETTTPSSTKSTTSSTTTTPTTTNHTEDPPSSETATPDTNSS
ncbi:hypothetical protein Pelo_1764 [Pelomyxa schiedti]|nr:hypothetical protein Pelo_1764 [Pelomyxa schiedti]